MEARRAGVPIGWAALREGGWRRESAIFWRFSVPAMLCSFMVLPVHWLGTALLAHQPAGYAELGLFNAANQWRVAILFVPQAMAGMVLPALAALHGERDGTRYWRVFWGNVALIAGVALALAAGVVLSSGWILRSYGADFSGGRSTLILLAGSAVVLSVNQILGMDLISRDQMWPVLGCNTAWAVTLLALAWWLVPLQGARGLATAMFVAYPVQSVCMLALNLRGAPPSPR